MAIGIKRTFPAVEVGVDRYDLERAIREAFESSLGKEEIIEVYVSRFPHEYGAVVLLRNAPSRQAETVALEQEERFQRAGLQVGILVQKARDHAKRSSHPTIAGRQ
jgi:hypothetical protein